MAYIRQSTAQTSKMEVRYGIVKAAPVDLSDIRRLYLLSSLQEEGDKESFDRAI